MSDEDVDWSRYNQPFGMLGDPNPIAYKTPHGNIYQSDVNMGMNLGTAFSGGGLSTKPIKAYHSSPHDFAKFDLGKIGSGEGAQVYGHGLYFAENPEVSGQGGQYWSQFLRKFSGNENEAAQLLKDYGFDREAAAAHLDRDIATMQARIAPGGIFDKPHMADARQNTQNFIDTMRAQQELIRRGAPVGPRTYEVDIHADPEHLLDWDKALTKQSPYTQSVIDQMIRDRGVGNWLQDFGHTQTGRDFYREYSVSPSRMSQTLNEQGVPGIKYLDQGSRAAGTGTSNYVVFNPDLIDIIKKYSIVGAPVSGAMGALAAGESWQPEQEQQ